MDKNIKRLKEMNLNDLIDLVGKCYKTKSELKGLKERDPNSEISQVYEGNDAKIGKYYVGVIITKKNIDVNTLSNIKINEQIRYEISENKSIIINKLHLLTSGDINHESQEMLKRNNVDYYFEETLLHLLEESGLDITYKEEWKELCEVYHGIKCDQFDKLDTVVGGSKKLKDMYVSLRGKEEGENVDDYIEMDSVLRRYDHVVITGGVGSGKTTLLKSLFINYVERMKHSEKDPVFIEVVFFVNLKELSNNEENIADFLIDDFTTTVKKEENLAIIEDLINASLSKGQCILLLDGFDDLNQSEQKETVKQINEILKWNSENRIIITSRRFAMYDLIDKFSVIELEDLNNEQRNILIEKWYPDNQESSLTIKDIIMENSSIKEIALTPLMMIIILKLIDPVQKEDLPRQKVEVYKLYVETMIDRFSNNKKIRDLAMETLKDLAFKIHEKNLSSITKNCIKSLFGDIYGEKIKIIKELVEKKVFLVEHEGGYTFNHTSFREYFVAKKLFDMDTFDEVFKHLYDKRWEEVILFLAGEEDGEKGNLIEAIESKELNDNNYKENMFLRNYTIKGKCAANTKNKEVAQRINYELYHLFKISNTELAEQIINIFSYSKPREIIKEICKELSSNNISISKTALLRLGRIKSEVAYEDIVEVLRREINQDIKTCAINALGEIRKTESENNIKEYLESSVWDYRVRAAAARAIGNIGGTEAYQILKENFDNVSDNIKKSIIDGLGTLGSKESTDKLVDIMKKDNYSYKVQLKAAEVLAANADNKINIVEKLISLFKRDQLKKGYIIKILGRYSDKNEKKEVLEILMEGLNDPLDVVKKQTILSFGELGWNEVGSELISILDNHRKTRREIYEAAIQTLGEIAYSESGNRLIEIAKNTSENSFIRQQAILSLGKIGRKLGENIPLRKKIVTTLFLMLEDSHEKDILRGYVAVALSTIRDQETTDNIIDKLLKLNEEYSDSHDFRMRLIESMGNFGDKKSVNALINCLKVDSKDIKYRSVEALGKIGDMKAVTPLKNLYSNLSQDSYGLRQKVFDVLFMLYNELCNTDNNENCNNSLKEFFISEEMQLQILEVREMVTKEKKTKIKKEIVGGVLNVK